MLKILSVANAKVVVFIPPPVEAGEAPTHIKKIINRIPGIVKSAISTVLKPAVRDVTEENMAVVNFPKDVVCGKRLVFCSEKRKNIAPAAIKIVVVYRTIFVFRLITREIKTFLFVLNRFETNFLKY